MTCRREVRFVLLCEGSSDQALASHLRKLLSHCGAAEAVGTSVPFGRVRPPEPPEKRPRSLLARRIDTVLSADSAIDLIFIHRDADAAGHEARAREVEEIMRGVQCGSDWLPVIPVRTTEAWLLLDEPAIRRVAGNPQGSQPLQLPRPSQVETVADPKETLRNALAAASGKRGRRLQTARKNFNQYRRILLEQLPVGGALEQVPAWRRLERRVSAFVQG